MTVKTLQRATQLIKLSNRNKKKLRYKENKLVFNPYEL